jgi:hypothetical protein
VDFDILSKCNLKFPFGHLNKDIDDILPSEGEEFYSRTLELIDLPQPKGSTKQKTGKRGRPRKYKLPIQNGKMIYAKKYLKHSNKINQKNLLKPSIFNQKIQ